MNNKTSDRYRTRRPVPSSHPVGESDRPCLEYRYALGYAGDSGLASLPSGLNFIAGVWLVRAPFALDYDKTGAGFNGRWNDIVLGIVIAMLALTRMFAPHRVIWFSGINVVLGAWLTCAPFVLEYNTAQDAAPAVINDTAPGIAVIVLALLSIAITMWGRSRSDVPVVASRDESA